MPSILEPVENGWLSNVFQSVHAEVMAHGRVKSLLEKPALTVAEVSALTGFNRMTVTRMFEHERGVLILGRPESMHKRRYRSLRIPRAVYERVIGRLAVR